MKSKTRGRNGSVILPETDTNGRRNGAAAEASVLPGSRPSYRTEDRLHLPLPVPPAVNGDGVKPDDRHALALFCFETPEAGLGRYVSELVAALSRRGTPVHLFSRHPFVLEGDDAFVHVLGECDGDDLLEQMREFTHRASNAFLREFPTGGARVTLMGFEWTSAETLSLLHGIGDLPTLLSLHSLERQRSDLGGDLSRQIDAIELRGLRESRTVLFHDPASREIVKYWAPDCLDRIVAARQPYLTRPFESDLDPGEVKARYQVGPIDPTVLFLGDLDERYGPDMLVKALPPVLKNHPQTRLIVVGDGALYWPLRVYTRYLLLEHAVRLVGNVEGQALNELIQASDVVVVPSRDATPWWPIQAAWAARRPVVATHNAAPGLLDHEKDGVLVYPSENSIVWGVERVLFDADLRGAMARRGVAKLEERFGWNVVAEQVLELMGAPARS